MSPTIHRQGAYRFYFNSREETRSTSTSNHRMGKPSSG